MLNSTRSGPLKNNSGRMQLLFCISISSFFYFQFFHFILLWYGHLRERVLVTSMYLYEQMFLILFVEKMEKINKKLFLFCRFFLNGGASTRERQINIWSSKMVMNVTNIKSMRFLYIILEIDTYFIYYLYIFVVIDFDHRNKKEMSLFGLRKYYSYAWMM